MGLVDSHKSVSRPAPLASLGAQWPPHCRTKSIRKVLGIGINVFIRVGCVFLPDLKLRLVLWPSPHRAYARLSYNCTTYSEAPLVAYGDRSTRSVLKPAL
ncbi:hypothetical protein EVAR_97710_1 [Eumeta japonica]|uniref:Uncharacterized protein n=1 Tax=Eumeta variegata TaxID=151549 RepID=A0A4C1XWE7_EUMVA|nr:hypothetical protein EVAR_97710_1 [Eumeta japonica]